MSTIRIRLEREGACVVTHAESGATLRTDAPPEFGGGGASFSATDLLAAALGACTATSIDTVALRHGVPLDALELRVTKALATSPKRIARLALTIAVRHALGPGVRQRLLAAAEACVVRRSLAPSVEVTVELVELTELVQGTEAGG